MNSFSFMELAINGEVERQIGLYTKYPDKDPKELITSGTYRWDATRKEAVLMRRKETIDDYRYFPEPDLGPLVLTHDFINQIRHTLPELPKQRAKRYTSQHSLTPYAVGVLLNEKAVCDYFEEALKHSSNPIQLCNWITVEFAGRLKDTGNTLASLGIPPVHVAKLVAMIDENKISGRIAKSVADDMVQNPGLDPEEIVKKNPDYQPLDASVNLEALVDQVLQENASSIVDYQAGRDRAFAFLVGQMMKLTKGKASPQIVNELLKKKLEKNDQHSFQSR
jgi:aspartyl-tRNA(Asn)/glutamyl-tRNA(Gln) amidotransferase subunit B